jgi:hypothetical protein
MKLYRGNIGDFTGGIVASWFVTGVKGPVAFATGFVEMRYAPWCLFYRGMSPYCQVPAPRLYRGIVSSMLDLMPAPRLI